MWGENDVECLFSTRVLTENMLGDKDFEFLLSARVSAIGELWPAKAIFARVLIADRLKMDVCDPKNSPHQNMRGENLLWSPFLRACSH